MIVQSESGDIRFPSAVQGSVSVVSGSGAVAAEKRVLGPSLDISTDTGPISVASCYSDQSKFSTQSGDMDLKNVHNDSYVAVYTDSTVKMSGIDGTANVFMKKGSLDIQMSHVRHESR